MLPIFFLTLIIQLCTNKIKDPLRTNCIALRMTPTKHGPRYTMTWLHEKETFGNKIGHSKIYMYGHMTLIPRY